MNEQVKGYQDGQDNQNYSIQNNNNHNQYGTFSTSPTQSYTPTTPPHLIPQNNQYPNGLYPPHMGEVFSGPVGSVPQYQQQMIRVEPPLMQQNFSGQPQGYNQYLNTRQYSPPAYAQGMPIDGQMRAVSNVQSSYKSIQTNLDHCDFPSEFRCNFCQKESTSTMTIEPGSGTYTMCILLCCFGALPGIIPFLLKDCKDKKHYCPFCGAQVGFKEYKPC